MSFIELLLHQRDVSLESLQESVHGACCVLELPNLLVLFGHLLLRDITDEREVVLDASEHVLGREVG